MSRQDFTAKRNTDFIERIIEVCGSSQPAVVARSLNISYQAAKNYLKGRLPDSKILLAIAERTPYSIHWLLTGQGDKFIETDSPQTGTLPIAGDLQAFVRRECLQIIGELLRDQVQPVENSASSRIVVLSPDQIKEERISEISDNKVSRYR